MKLTQLLHLYPQAFITKDKLQNDKYLAFPLEQYFVNFSKDYMSSTEKNLLDVLFRQGQIILDITSPSIDPWKTYLTKSNTLIPNTNKLVRQILFYLEFKKSDFTIYDWLTAFSQMLADNYLTVYPLSTTTGNLVESHTKQSPSLWKLTGIIQTLDSDFSTKSHVFVGNFWKPVNGLKKNFQAETKVFESELPFFHGQVFNLQQVLFHCLHCQTLPSELIKNYYKQLQNYPEIIEIVPILYRLQGNISSAAKQLYMHRNTIQYRIEKFYIETGMSLKQMDDLVFCYFLLTSHWISVKNVDTFP